MANMFPPDCSCAFQAQHDCGPLGLGCAWNSFVDTITPKHIIPSEIHYTPTPESRKDAENSPLIRQTKSFDPLVAAGITSDKFKDTDPSHGCAKLDVICILNNLFSGLAKNFGHYLPYIAIGGGALLIILLAKKR